MTKKRRVALKYCGGCNPGFDRVEYFRRIMSAASDSIEWVTLENPGFDALLLIQGCDTACPERSLDLTGHGLILSLKNDKIDPIEVVKRLLGGENED